MGKQIDLLSRIELADNPVKTLYIERNQGDIIHIQTGAWRIELTIAEFELLCESIEEANQKLEDIKSL